MVVNPSTQSPEWDVLIVGGGPAGLNAALTLGRSLRSVLVIDSGLPRNRFASHSHNYLTRDGASPQELLGIGREEALRYGVEFISGEAVHADVENDGKYVALDLADGSRVTGRRLLVTSGVTDTLPDIPGLADRWGRDVIHCPYCHGYEVRGERLGVIAAGPYSMHVVQLFRQLSDKVTVFLNDEFEPEAADLESLAARNIGVVSGPVTRLETQADGSVAGLVMADSATVPLDAIVVTSQMNANSALLSHLDVAREENAFASWISTDMLGATSLPGVYAAGNVASPNAWVGQAASSGVMAAAGINMHLAEEDTERAIAAHRASAPVSSASTPA